MKRLITTYLLLIIASACYAQSNSGFSLTGELRDSVTQEPLAFASILVVNKNQGIASDLQGRFTIPVNLGDSIKVTSIGYGDYTFLVTVEMNATGFIKTIEMSEEALKLADFELFQMSDNFYLKRKLPDSLPPVRGLGWASMPLIGIPSKYVPEADPQFQFFATSIPIFQNISRNPKQDRILKKIEEADTFQKTRQKEREKYFNKSLVKRITRIDDRVIDEFMEFCNFLDGEIIGKTEYQLSQKILIRYQEFLIR